MAQVKKIAKTTINYFAKECFKLMLQRGIYETSYVTTCGTVLECAFDADEWHVVVSYVTPCMLPVSLVVPVRKGWNS